LLRFIGASGTYSNCAPFPPADTGPLPKTLIAYTVAQTLDPQGNRYGASINTEIGTVHVRVFMIVNVFNPSQ